MGRFKNIWKEFGSRSRDKLADIVNNNLLSSTESSGDIESTNISLFPGKIRFTNLSNEQLNDFAVIPEESKSNTDTITPLLNVTYNCDGCYWRRKKGWWLKIPNDCEANVSINGKGNVTITPKTGRIAKALNEKIMWVNENDKKHPVRNPFID